jgi:hypothetical protein
VRGERRLRPTTWSDGISIDKPEKWVDKVMEQKTTSSTTHDANGFKKGHEKFGGPKVESVNRATKMLKEAILLAAELEGSDGEGKDELVGFLRKVAKEDRRSFVMLLGRVLPLQAESRTDMRAEAPYRTVEEVRHEMEERGITLDVIKRIMDPPPE